MYDTEKSTYNYIKVDKSCQMKYMKMHQNIRSECYWVRATFPQIDPQQIALDGKEVHHSMDPANDWSNLRMISAWAVENGIVLGQVAVDDTSNEITALPSLLALVDVRDCDITADALHCQTATIEAIRAADAHYTLCVKSNQKTLYQDIMATFTTLRAEDHPSLQPQETVEKQHGRIETRRYWITEDLSRLTTRDSWHDLHSIGMVESERQIGTKTSQKTRYSKSTVVVKSCQNVYISHMRKPATDKRNRYADT